MLFTIALSVGKEVLSWEEIAAIAILFAFGYFLFGPNEGAPIRIGGQGEAYDDAELRRRMEEHLREREREEEAINEDEDDHLGYP